MDETVFVEWLWWLPSLILYIFFEYALHSGVYRCILSKFFTVFTFCGLKEHCIKDTSCQQEGKHNKNKGLRHQCVVNAVIMQIFCFFVCSSKTLFASGYMAADCYKKCLRKNERKQFIKICNLWNAWISFGLLGFLIFWLFISGDSGNKASPFMMILTAFIFWRFLSRSLEIMIAFSRDVVNENKSRSSLKKHDRIKLSIISYMEIFFYSAALYGALFSSSIMQGACKGDTTSAVRDGLLASLGTGTLTNVGESLTCFSGYWQLLPFIQVFTTLSLVVLSLAMYASRSDEKIYK